MKAIDDALVMQLATVGAAGGVHNVLRPQRAGVWPVIVFSLVGGEDAHAFDGSGPTSYDYDVKVIAPIDEQDGVGAVIEAVHEALQRVPLTITGCDHLQTLRLRRLPTYPDSADGRAFLHRGATYRVWVTPSE